MAKASAETKAARKAARDKWRDANPSAYEAKARRDLARRHSHRTDGKFSANDIDSLYDNQHGRCAYCRITLEGAYEIDHIEPIALGGTNDLSNIALVCRTCNRSKGSKTMMQWIGLSVEYVLAHGIN